MGVIVRRGETDFEATPMGLQDAVCVNVFDVGLQRWDDKTQHKVVVLFELAERRSDGKPFTLHKMFTASLHDRATLRGFLEGWRGKAFTPQELADGWDLDRIIGVSCQLNLVEKQTPDRRTYIEIASVMRPRVNLVAATPRSYVPEFVRRKRESQVIPELEAARARQAAAAQAPRAEGTYSPPPPYQARPSTPPPAPPPDEEFNDDIPF